MLTTSRIDLSWDCVVIDPWPEPELTDRYRAMVAWITAQRNCRQIILASYESGSIDPAFYPFMTENSRVCLYEPQLPLGPRVLVMGQEWWRCVHARPLGIHQLIAGGRHVRVDLNWVWRRHRPQQWQNPTAESLGRDSYQWQHLEGTEWLLSSTEHNQMISRLHLKQQA